MPKARPTCSIKINFKSGKHYRIDLFPKYVYFTRRIFEIKFTENGIPARSGSGTITKMIDRLRRLLVKELSL